MNWVCYVGGQPRVRWWRIVAVMASIFVCAFIGATIAGRLTETSTNIMTLLAPLCVAGVYFVIVVELQLQRLRYGTWRFRYSLRSILLLTAIAAAIDALSKCRRLKVVVIDERRLQQDHLDDLRASLPHIMLNGKTWAQRDRH